MAIAIVLVCAVGAGAVAGVRWEADQRAEDVRDEAEARAVDVEAAAAERRNQICEESRNLRALVGELIDTAVSGEPGVSLLEPDSFRLLPSSVQQYLREYVALTAGQEGDPPDLGERLREFQRTRLGDLPEFCTEEPAP